MSSWTSDLDSILTHRCQAKPLLELRKQPFVNCTWKPASKCGDVDHSKIGGRIGLVCNLVSNDIPYIPKRHGCENDVIAPRAGRSTSQLAALQRVLPRA